MIWTKTEAGRTEMQKRALLTDRQQRTLLLLIDGNKSEEMLLAHMAGLTSEHFQALQRHGLIEEATASSRSSASSRAASASAAAAPVATPALAATDTDDVAVTNPPIDVASLDYGQFTARVTQLISRELGLRGFTLTLAVEKASTIEDLIEVGRRVIEQIRSRKGDGAAETARQALFG